MPAKSTPTTANNPPQNSALGVAVTKKKKKKDFKVDASGRIVGRPPFNTRAKRLIGKSHQGQDLDRRHLVHYAEEIKPFGELVIRKVKAEYAAGTPAVVKDALVSRGCKRLPSAEQELLNRLINEVNSSTMNLVPDDAPINKAIEIVRANLRKLREQWVSDPEVQRIFHEMNATNYKQTTDRLKLNAKHTLILSGAATDITRAIQEINNDLIALIDGAADTHALFTLIGDLENSVTFDISSKASREKIQFANEWRNRAIALEVNSKSQDNADELLTHLVGLIEHY